MAFQSWRRMFVPFYRRSRRYRLYWKLMLVTLVFIALTYIPLQLAFVNLLFPQPQAILTLGGRPAREAFTAEFAQAHPKLEIWISSGMEPGKANPLFTAAGVDLNRVHFDVRATDTVTNFTSLVNEFERRRFHHVYLITSDFHMSRARAIAAIVFGSRGILTTPVVVPSNTLPESKIRILRDVVRSLVWLVTQRTGASLRFQPWITALR